MCRKRKWQRYRKSVYYKRNYGCGRNLHDPIYQQFRKDVITRDSNKCQWPGCKCNNNLEVHHILKWADYPHLRFERSNAITLCRFHHKLIKNYEDYYVEFFRKLLEMKLLSRLKELK